MIPSIRFGVQAASMAASTALRTATRSFSTKINTPLSASITRVAAAPIQLASQIPASAVINVRASYFSSSSEASSSKAPSQATSQKAESATPASSSASTPATATATPAKEATEASKPKTASPLKLENAKTVAAKVNLLMDTLNVLYTEKEHLLNTISGTSDIGRLHTYSTMLQEVNQNITTCFDTFVKSMNSTIQSKKEITESIRNFKSSADMQANLTEFVANLTPDLDDAKLNESIKAIKVVVDSEGKRCTTLTESLDKYAKETKKKDDLETQLSTLEKEKGVHDPEYKELSRTLTSKKEKLNSILEDIMKVKIESKNDYKNLKNLPFTADDDHSLTKTLNLKIEDLKDLNNLFINSKFNYFEFEKLYEAKYKNKNTAKLAFIYFSFRTQRAIASGLLTTALALFLWDTAKESTKEKLHGLDNQAKTNISEILQFEEKYQIESNQKFKEIIYELKVEAKGRDGLLDQEHLDEIAGFEKANKYINFVYSEKINKIKQTKEKVTAENFEETRKSIEQARAELKENSFQLKSQIRDRIQFYQSRKVFAMKLTTLGLFIKEHADDSTTVDAKKKFDGIKDEYTSLKTDFDVNKSVTEAYEQLKDAVYPLRTTELPSDEEIKAKLKDTLNSCLKNIFELELKYISRSTENKLGETVLNRTKEKYEKLSEDIKIVQASLDRNSVSSAEARQDLKKIYSEYLKDMQNLSKRASTLEGNKDDFIIHYEAPKKRWGWF